MKKPDPRFWIAPPMYRTEIDTSGFLFTWGSALLSVVVVFYALKKLNEKWLTTLHTSQERFVKSLCWFALITPHLVPALTFFFTFSFRNVTGWYMELKTILMRLGLVSCELNWYSREYPQYATPRCEYQRLSETTEIAITVFIGGIAIAYLMYIIQKIKIRKNHFWQLYIPNIMISLAIATIVYFIIFSVFSYSVPNSINVPTVIIP